jgi:tripeptidyl-peptidase-1
MHYATLPLFAFGLLFGLTVANPVISPYVVHEKRNHVPSGWSWSRKYPATSILPLRFGLTQPNIDVIEEYLDDVSHPDSPNFGKHWTASQVAEKFAATDETIRTVRNWLLDNGFAKERVRVTPTRGWIGNCTTLYDNTEETADHSSRGECHG